MNVSIRVKSTQGPQAPLTPRGGSRSVTLHSSSLPLRSRSGPSLPGGALASLSPRYHFVRATTPHSPGRLSLRYTTLLLATLRCAAAPHSPGRLSLRSTTLVLATLRCAAAPHRCRCAGEAPNVQAHVGTAVHSPWNATLAALARAPKAPSVPTCA